MWEELNKDLLISILLKWLGVRELVKFDTAMADRSNRFHFLEVLRSRNSVMNATCCLYTDKEDLGCIRWFTNRQVKCSRLELSGNKENLAYVKKYFTLVHHCVESVSLDEIERTLAPMLTKEISCCVRLRELILKSSNLQNKDVKAFILAVQHKASVNSIVLERLDISSASLKVVGETFPNIKKMSISADFTGTVRYNFAEKAFTKLEELEVVSSQMSPVSARYILEHALKLRELVIILGNSEETVHIASIHCRNLTKFHLVEVMTAPDGLMDQDCKNIFGANKLRDVALKDVVSGPLLAHLCSLCPTITSLRVEWHQQPAAVKDIAAAVRHLGDLRRLRLSLDHFDDSTCNELVEALVEHCPHLTALTLEVYKEVSEGVAIRLVESCRELREIEINQSESLRDAFVRAVAKNLPRLTHLTLRLSESLTDASVVDLVEACRDLDTLSLVYSPRLTNAAVEHIVRHSSCLKNLSISCNGLTPASVKLLAARAAVLASLNLAHVEGVECQHLDDLRTAVQAANAANPGLQITGL